MPAALYMAGKFRIDRPGCRMNIRRDGKLNRWRTGCQSDDKGQRCGEFYSRFWYSCVHRHSQTAARGIGADQSGSQLAERMAMLGEQRARLLRQDRPTLTAPIAGSVRDLAVRLGQRVDASTVLAAIVPSTGALEVQLYAPSSAVGFVRRGQKVQLTFDAFPFQKYGTSSGTVTWVSCVPSAPTGMAQGSTASEPVFRVRVKIDADGKAGVFRPASCATA